MRYLWILVAVLVLCLAACGNVLGTGWTTRTGTVEERLAWLEAEVSGLRSGLWFSARECSRCDRWRERDDENFMVWKYPDFNMVVEDAPEHASVQFVCPVCMEEIMENDPALIRDARQNGCLLSYEAWWEEIEQYGLFGKPSGERCSGCLGGAE